jgi:RimJ/RimL family protein N-acetyltransferase
MQKREMKLTLPACQCTTTQGNLFMVRRVTQNDQPQLAQLLQNTSEQSRWQRYVSARPLTSSWVEEEAQRMAQGDRWPQVALVAVANQSGTLLAIAEMLVDRKEPQLAEIAFLVRDERQGQGIGRSLAEHLAALARLIGVRTVHANLVSDNTIMQRLMGKFGLVRVESFYPGELKLVADLPAIDRSIDNLTGSLRGAVHPQAISEPSVYSKGQSSWMQPE